MIDASIVRPKPKPIRRVKDKPKPVVKVSSRGSLISKAHAIMRDIVLDRDLRCVCPVPPLKGHTSVLQAGHLINSTKGSVRFDLSNVHVQCSGCNQRHVNFQHYYIDWFLGKFGQEEYHRLVHEANNGKPLKTYELAELIVQLKAIRSRQLADSLQGIPFRPYFSQADILSGGWRNK